MPDGSALSVPSDYKGLSWTEASYINQGAVGQSPMKTPPNGLLGNVIGEDSFPTTIIGGASLLLNSVACGARVATNVGESVPYLTVYGKTANMDVSVVIHASSMTINTVPGLTSLFVCPSYSATSRKI